MVQLISGDCLLASTHWQGMGFTHWQLHSHISPLEMDLASPPQRLPSSGKVSAHTTALVDRKGPSIDARTNHHCLAHNPSNDTDMTYTTDAADAGVAASRFYRRELLLSVRTDTPYSWRTYRNVPWTRGTAVMLHAVSWSLVSS